MAATKSKRRKVVTCRKCSWTVTALDKFDAERQLKEHRAHQHSDS